MSSGTAVDSSRMRSITSNVGQGPRPEICRYAKSLASQLRRRKRSMLRIERKACAKRHGRQRPAALRAGLHASDVMAAFAFGEPRIAKGQQQCSGTLVSVRWPDRGPSCRSAISVGMMFKLRLSAAASGKTARNPLFGGSDSLKVKKILVLVADSSGASLPSLFSVAAEYRSGNI